MKKGIHRYDREPSHSRWVAIFLLCIFTLFISLDPTATFSGYVVKLQNAFVLNTSNFFLTPSLELNQITLDGNTGFTPKNTLAVANYVNSNINGDNISYTISLQENSSTPIFNLYTDDGVGGKTICPNDTINSALSGGSSNTNNHDLYLGLQDSAALEGNYPITITLTSLEPYIRSYNFNVIVQIAGSDMIIIEGTDIERPNVEIPQGEILVFKDNEYAFLTPADLVGGPVVIDDVVLDIARPELTGGSLYIPESVGELVVGSNQTINWDVYGNIIIEPSIEINNNNISVNMLSHNGNIIMNDITMTGGSSNPYVVNITAENGGIEANGTEIISKSDGSGKINLVAQDDINIVGAKLESAGDKGIKVQSTAGNINAEGANIKSTGGGSNAVIIMESAGFINSNQATIASKVNLTIKGVEGVNARSANITNSSYGKDITITSSNGGIDLSSLAAPSPKTVVSSSNASVYITSKADISIISAKISASTGWGMKLEFAATGSGSSLWVQSATVQGASIKANNLTISGTLAGGAIPTNP